MGYIFLLWFKPIVQFPSESARPKPVSVNFSYFSLICFCFQKIDE